MRAFGKLGSAPINDRSQFSFSIEELKPMSVVNLIESGIEAGWRAVFFDF